MTDYYWAAAAAGNASVDTNWSPVGVPGSGDTVIFTSANSIKDCTMNIAEVTTLTMQRTYTGTITLDNGFTVSGDLTITAGTVDTGADHDLTVGGTLYLMPERDGGGTDPDAILICNDSDITAGELESWGVYHSGAYNPKCVFTGGTGDHEYGKMTLMVGTNVVLSSGITELTAGGAAFRLGTQIAYNTYDNGGGTVKFTSASDQLLYSTSAAADDFKQFYNLILEKTTSTLQGMTTVGFHIRVENDLTITSGILNTKTTSPTLADHDLTVEGTTTIGSAGATGVDYATLITNESAIDLQGTNGGSPGLEMLAGGTFNGVGNANHTMGSVKAAATTYNSKIYFTSGTTTVNEEATGNYAFVVYSPTDVNFYHGNGTVEITTPTYAYMYCYDPFYNLIINHAGAAGQKIVLSNGVPLAVDNDLTLSDGDFATNLQNIVVNGDCYVNNAGHDFDARGAALTVLGEFTLCDGTTYIAGENPSYSGYFSGDNIFGCISVSGGATMTATTANTILTGNVGSTNQDGYDWTPFYLRGSFYPNSGTFINASNKSYIAFKSTSEGPYSNYVPFYNFIIDFDGGVPQHVQNTRIRVLNDYTFSGTATEGAYGVYGHRIESTNDTQVDGNMFILSGAGFGAPKLENMTTVYVDGNITVENTGHLMMPTSSAGGITIGGGLFNYGTIGQAEDSA